MLLRTLCGTTLSKAFQTVMGSAAVLVFASNGQAATDVALTKLHHDGWLYNAVMDDTDGDGHPEVIALLALRDGEVVGDNINSIWYIRGDSEWGRKAWTTQNAWEAVNELKMTYDIGDAQDGRWMLPDTAVPTTSIGSSASFDGVVFSNDPIAPLLAAVQNDGVTATALVEAGYAAAANSIEFNPGPGVICDPTLVLEGMAFAIEAAEEAPMAAKANSARLAWAQIAPCDPPDVIVPGDIEFPVIPPEFTCNLYMSPVQPSDQNIICYKWTEITVQLESRVVFQWINGHYVPCYQTRRGERRVSYECCWAGSAPGVCPGPNDPTPVRPTSGTCGRNGILIQPMPPNTTIQPFTWTPWGPSCIATN